MRCWNCRRPSGYREQVLKAIGGLAIALANDGKLEEAQQELDTLQKKGASSGDCDLVAAEILSLQWKAGRGTTGAGYIAEKRRFLR